VSVLLIKSLRADREFSPFGVTGQAQQEINSSAGSNVYTLTQMRPAGSKPFNVPAFVRLTYESPLSRLARYRSWKTSEAEATRILTLSTPRLKKSWLSASAKRI